ncbi:MAG: hypothetical protein H0U65_04930 [Rubrobacter sp.]|nr:hypothetical protein [Rubrobacter sp.]
MPTVKVAPTTFVAPSESVIFAVIVCGPSATFIVLNGLAAAAEPPLKS